MSGEPSPKGMCCLRRSSLSLRFQRKCQVRGLLSVLGEGSAWGAAPQTALCVPNTSHQCPCLSSAPGLPTGPRSQRSSTWRLGQGMGDPVGRSAPLRWKPPQILGPPVPSCTGSASCSPGHHGLAGEMSSGDHRQVSPWTRDPVVEKSPADFSVVRTDSPLPWW